MHPIYCDPFLPAERLRYMTFLPINLICLICSRSAELFSRNISYFLAKTSKHLVEKNFVEMIKLMKMKKMMKKAKRKKMNRSPI